MRRYLHDDPRVPDLHRLGCDSATSYALRGLLSADDPPPEWVSPLAVGLRGGSLVETPGRVWHPLELDDMIGRRLYLRRRSVGRVIAASFMATWNLLSDRDDPDLRYGGEVMPRETEHADPDPINQVTVTDEWRFRAHRTDGHDGHAFAEAEADDLSRMLNGEPPHPIADMPHRCNGWVVRVERTLPAGTDILDAWRAPVAPLEPVA